VLHNCTKLSHSTAVFRRFHSPLLCVVVGFYSFLTSSRRLFLNSQAVQLSSISHSEDSHLDTASMTIFKTPDSSFCRCMLSSVCLVPSVYLTLCVSACMSLFVCLCMSLYVTVCLCMSLYLFFCLSLSLSADSVCVFLSVCFCLSVSVYLSVCLSVSVCLSLFVYIFLVTFCCP